MSLPRRILTLLQRAGQAAFLYNARAPVRLLLRLACRARVVGWERVPLGNGLIVAANHTSLADPVVVQAYVPRHLTFLMTEVYYRLPLLGGFCRFYGCIPVREQAMNRPALRAAVAALRAGRALGVFPEGGISRDGHIHPAKPGIALLAQHAGVPIVPVGLHGVNRLLPPDTWTLRRASVTMVVGEPVAPEGHTRAQLTARVSRAIRACARRAEDLAQLGDGPAAPPAKPPEASRCMDERPALEHGGQRP